MPDKKQPTLLLIDGHSLAFRAFYALPVDSFQTRDGQHTNAVHGFLSMLLMLLRNEQPTHVAVAFDVSRVSFRTREYAEYKATRGETPSEFGGQIPILKEALHTLGITTIEKEDFEADDILATLATQGAGSGFKVLVVSGDRDTIQLVTPQVTLLYPSRQGVSDLTTYDEAKVFDKYGIRPEQYPEIAALVGETSDNLPGIPKVGEKTALKWLQQYGSLDGILEHRDEIKGVVGQNLRDHAENAIRNRRLNALIRDVELPVVPEDLPRRPVDEEAMRELFGRLEFRTLLDRVLKQEGLDGSEVGRAAEARAAAEAPKAPTALTLLDDELEAWLARTTAANPDGLALQLETIDGLPITIAVATEDESLTLPWSAGRPGYAPLERWLASDAPKLMHGAKPQLKALSRAGLAFAGLAFDCEIAAWLVRPDSSGDRSLAKLVDRQLGEQLPAGDPNQLVPVSDTELGVSGEAWFVGRLARHMRDSLDERTLRVLTEIELPVLSVLASMELTGVTVSHTELTELSTELTVRANDIATEAFGIIGREINLGSPKQIQEVLFDQLEMPKTRSTKTGYSTDAGALADLQDSHPHPFLGLLLAHRDATKLKQIIESVDKAIAGDHRVHTTYVQTGSSTGRISSTDPNLQNIPIRAEEGRRIRKAFTVGTGYESLLTADYSQIEMRIMAHLSGDQGLIDAFHSGEDLHRFVGSRVFSVDPADVTPAMRTKVKAMSYGLAYGLSAFGLSKQLRIETAEAKQLMGDYFERFGGVRDYLRNVVVQAKIDGYTETIFGRRRPFANLNSNNRVLRDNDERAALNAPIQGSAADIIKIAMVDIAGDLAAQGLASKMLLQVHDELVFDVAAGEWDALSEIVTTRMAGAATLSVPLEVQVGRGPDWDSAAH
ncbi:DNA polymerase I [Cnuibacter physcomitrellae]|uniref:DNA polymerase I n=1 Tax=Cnuibacter physcomitrellae TaxID=1619308 RepID=A0A1X9LJJ1_9MICO|nr:DNA polymerase I [Cnuibacter physcomitrellae]ARJ05376.1 DNA polymerase I [Cnuibacter physcomitrellae]GGI35569.1 DNA polymerase I [Cnuibacter physcomitrellae]